MSDDEKEPEEEMAKIMAEEDEKGLESVNAIIGEHRESKEKKTKNNKLDKGKMKEKEMEKEKWFNKKSDESADFVSSSLQTNSKSKASEEVEEEDEDSNEYVLFRVPENDTFDVDKDKNNKLLEEKMEKIYNEVNEEMYEHIRRPLNEKEPGFPQLIHFNDKMFREYLEEKQIKTKRQPKWVPELGEEQQEMGETLPKFPIYRPLKENLEPRNQIDPKSMREVFNAMGQSEQDAFLKNLVEAFPQFTYTPNNDNNNEDLPQGVANQLEEEENQQKEQINELLNVIFNNDIFQELVDLNNGLFVDLRTDDGSKQLDEYMLRRNREEEEDNCELIRQKQLKKKRFKETNLSDILKSGLQSHNELFAMRNIKKLLSGQQLVTPDKPPEPPKPFYGRAQVYDMNRDELLLLFDRFTFQGQLVLSLSNTYWEEILQQNYFNQQIYLWFSNEEKNTQRFLPIEDCCELCHPKIMSEPVIRVMANVFLYRIIDEVLIKTRNLRCLRLYRFELDRVVYIQKLSESCPNLEHFDLTESFNLNLNVIIELTQLFPFIIHLLLSSTNLNEEMLNSLLERLKNLQTLDVSSTLIDGTSLIKLPHCLKRLDIRCCPKIKRETLLDFLRKTRINRLLHLKMDPIFCPELYDLLGRKFPNIILFELNQFYDRVLRAEEFVIGSSNSGIHRFHGLQSLTFGRRVAVNFTLLSKLFTFCGQIRSFSMQFEHYGDRHLSDDNLALIGRHWSLLERLEIIRCPAAQNAFSISISKLSHLNYLNVEECIRLNDQSFPDFIRKTTAKTIVMDGCHNLGKATIDAIILKAKLNSENLFKVSMLKCGLSNLPYLKSKLLPKNLRITYSIKNSRKYSTFDGQRTKIGRIENLIEYLKEN